MASIYRRRKNGPYYITYFVRPRVRVGLPKRLQLHAMLTQLYQHPVAGAQILQGAPLGACVGHDFDAVLWRASQTEALSSVNTQDRGDAIVVPARRRAPAFIRRHLKSMWLPAGLPCIDNLVQA